MANVNAERFSVGGTSYPIIDQAARTNAEAALACSEDNRLALIGKYDGQSIATLLAGEIGGGTVYDALHKRIVANNFSGLRVGDYLDVPLVSASGVAGQQSVRFVIAHIDPYLRSQLKGWETAFEACLPEGLTKYILTQRVMLEERYSASGALTDSNNWSWQDIGKIWSLSEMEVYGCPVWGTPCYSVGFDCQFDLFKDTAHRLNGSRCSWWLRSVRGGSSALVCCVHYFGGADYYDATNAWVRPRVGFLLG